MTKSSFSGCLWRRTCRAFCYAAVCSGVLWTAPARAQLKLPAIPLPKVPDVTSNLGVPRVVPEVQNTLDATARHIHIRQLLRTHRDVLEQDPQGDPIVRGELIGFGISAPALERALAAGFSLIRTNTLAGLDLDIVVLGPPHGRSVNRALKQLRSWDAQGSYDFNHLYTGSGETRSEESPQTLQAASEVASTSARLGLIDGGIDRDHPALRETRIHGWGCEDRVVPSAHGTAIASLMVGSTPRFHGVAPASDLFAADVYCAAPTGGAVETIAAAFAWLASNQVPVINVSLVGPKNAALEQVVRIITARGHLVVAAVGNDGPSAPPLYPAAYPHVIGVTAVDSKRRVLLEAGRGTHVMFAAPGADMIAANAAGNYAEVRGTSFAAPIVAGLLSLNLQLPDPANAEHALLLLEQSALDLGARGRDSTYGYGMVGEQYRTEAMAAPSAAR